MRNIILLVATSVLSSFPIPSEANESAPYVWPTCGRVDEFPDKEWVLKDPQEVGWDNAQLRKAEELFQSMESAGLMVVHKGKLVASWGKVDEKYANASMRKALIHSLVGNAIDKGHFSLNDTLEKLDIQDTNPALTQEERQATVADLLQTRSGIFHSALFEVGSWKRVRSDLAQSDYNPAPGELWIYNNWDFNVVGTVLENSTGQKIGPMFSSQISKPLNMNDFVEDDVVYLYSSDISQRIMDNHSDFPAYDFKTSVRDIARYGLMYLNCGRWEEKQVVSKNWVLKSIDGPAITEGAPERFQGAFSTLGSYGYLQWIEKPGMQKYMRDVTISSPWYYGSGYRGHFYMVWPALDLVIAHQVSNWGGNSLIGQLGRKFFGSPSVNVEELSELLYQIILAHPKATDAFQKKRQ